MKKRILITFSFTLIVSHLSFGQNLLWSKKTDQSQASNGLVTDKNGIVYSYGLRNNMTYTTHTSPDTLGSFLESYSTDGSVIFTKKWAMPFYIQQMEYDGDQYFYFAATFSGTQTMDGITIISHGNIDGVSGKMDLTGHILWMKTFGGPGVDQCNDLCFNSTDNSMYTTGSIRDTLFLNNTFESISQQSGIILHYSSTGAFINHKLYDFVPERNVGGNVNSGREILKGLSGNFFLLMDRDGKDWNGPDTVAGPIMGRYVIKLDSNLDTVWSTYIIGPASYYGWGGNSLRTSSNGDVYMTMESSGKYGGTAHLFRLNGSSGLITWDYTNEDGHYTDLYIDNNTVYLIGNEGADGCPCETNNGGYYVLKKFDENNNLLGETRFSNVYLNNITKDISGNIFVTGNFYDKTAVIGKDTLQGDIDTLFSPGLPRYFGRFLTKLSDINCTAPVISVSVPSSYGHYYPLCSGSTATLTVNLTQGTFVWSNDATGTQTNVNSTGFYSVMNTQPNGCKAYSLPVDIQVHGATPGTISGNTTVCSGGANTYSVTPVNGASSYTWVLPSGWTGTSTSNRINTTASTTSGNISVTATSVCGTSGAQTISVSVGSTSIPTPGAISGNNTICSGSSNTYSITAVNGASSYIWTLPSGWTGSSTTNSINTTASSTSGNISVKGNSGCGTSTARTRNITVNVSSSGTPGVISGNTTVCSGSSNTYTINPTNSTASYIWTLPPGWTGSSTSSSISAIAGSTGGNISVTENGLCGAYTPKTITVPTIDNTATQTGNTLSANMLNANYQWIDCGNNNEMIPGATNQAFIASVAGNYAVIVMNSNCLDTSACYNVTSIGVVDNAEVINFSVFPNPADNFIAINYKNNEAAGNIYLEIKNITGQTIYTASISSFQGEYKKVIDLIEEHPGIYFVQIIANGQIAVKKIVLN